MLIVITGPMFSGKTTELIRRIHCATIARQKTLVLKPMTDTRSGLEVVSHSGLRWAADLADPKIASLRSVPPEVDVIGIDEAQFLSEAWVDEIDAIADEGREVVLACLNQDFRGEPFGVSGRLLAIADEVIHLKAVCVECGAKDAATKSYRLSQGGDQVEIGGAEKYQALCRRCWAAKKVVARGAPTPEQQRSQDQQQLRETTKALRKALIWCSEVCDVEFRKGSALHDDWLRTVRPLVDITPAELRLAVSRER